MSARISSRSADSVCSGLETPTVVDTAAVHNPVSPARPELADIVSLSGRVMSNRHNHLDDHKVGRAVINAIPGYRGFIPGKVSESVTASSFAKTNLIAQHIRQGHQMPWTQGISNPMGLKSVPGANIPGYKGYIPGKHVENVVGETFKRGNELSTAIKRRQYISNQQVHDQQLEAGRRIFGPRKLEGNAGLYPLYRSLMRD